MMDVGDSRASMQPRISHLGNTYTGNVGGWDASSSSGVPAAQGCSRCTRDVLIDEQELPEPVKLRAICVAPDEWEKLGTHPTQFSSQTSPEEKFAQGAPNSLHPGANSAHVSLRRRARAAPSRVLGEAGVQRPHKVREDLTHTP